MSSTAPKIPTFAGANFFILGAAKCGTTSLHRWLEQHLDICMSSPKEPFFFEAEYGRGLEFYHSKYFQHWRGERIVGESRHRNLYLPYVPRRILNLSPSAKFLICMRNPVERAFSHWAHWYTRGKETLPFDAAIRADYDRIQAGQRIASVLEIEHYTCMLDRDGTGPYRTYVDSGYYAEQICSYLEYFDIEQFKFILFEELAQNPQETVSSILRFLEVEPAFARNISYAPQNIRKHAMREFLNASTAKFLAAHFEPHNERLERVIGMSLSHWNQPFTDSRELVA